MLFLDTHFAVWILAIVLMGYVVVVLMMFEESVISVAQSSVETIGACGRLMSQHALIFQCALAVITASRDF